MAENHSHYRKQSDRDHAAKIRHHMAGGGDMAQDKALIRKAIDEHDEQLHGGKKTKLKLARGGHVEGEKAKERLDRAPLSRATGGRTKGKSGHKTTVNIVMPQSQGQDRPVPVPVPAGPGAMPPRPPMAGPPPGTSTPGGMPMGAGAPPPRPPMGPPVGAGAPMPMRKRGGRVSEEAGAGGGLGRLAKIKEYGKDSEGDREDKPFAEDTENRKMARGGRR